MTGHRRGVTQGDTLHKYGLYTSIVDDVTFADWIKSDLLNYNSNDINDITKIVYVSGFCNCYGFWDDREIDEMKDVCNHISFAAADEGLGFGDTIDGDPDHSFMKYWKDAVEDTVGITIQRAYVNAETDRLSDEECINDVPIRVYKATNWDSIYSLFGRKISVEIDGPEILGYKDFGTYGAEWNAWPRGSFNYQWWKKFSGQQNWITHGTDSTQTERMIETSFWVKVRVMRGDTQTEDSLFVMYEEGPEKFENSVESYEAEKAFLTPNKYLLYTNHPNPFNPETTIRYDLPESAEVMIEIFDVSGRRFRTLVKEQKDAGEYEVMWDGCTDQGIQAPSGMYIYQIRAGDFVQRKKMLLLR